MIEAVVYTPDTYRRELYRCSYKSLLNAKQEIQKWKSAYKYDNSDVCVVYKRTRG